jgi:hypothetical protein
MAQEARAINLNTLQDAPAWRRLVDDVRLTKQPAILQEKGKDVVEIRVVAPATRRIARKRRGLEPGDALDQLIGFAALGTTDLAEQHDRYLAEAYADPHA